MLGAARRGGLKGAGAVLFYVFKSSKDLDKPCMNAHRAEGRQTSCCERREVS